MFGVVTPIPGLPPFGHSVNGIGGVVIAAGGKSSLREGGAFGSAGAASLPISNL